MKKINLFHKALFVIAFTFINQIGNAQTATPLDNYILNYMSDHHLPGLAVTTIKNGKIAWAKGYGYADIDKDIPFTPNTINAEIASISKTVTATAIMKLWEHGLFQLDDPINNYLPFAIKNPYYPNNPITFRMLLLHTSSINDDSIPDNYNYNFNSVPTVSLENDLRDYLVVGGSHYKPAYFNNYTPGSQRLYNNTNFELLGYLVERISGITFFQYCRQNIFAPLCMHHTGWYFKDVDTNIVSRPYNYSNLTHKQNDYSSFDDYDLYETPDYPARQLKTTVVDLSKFLLMNMNYGILDGVRILDSTTVATIRTIGITTYDNTDYYSGQGLAWIYFKIKPNSKIPQPANSELWGHDGGDNGISTTMFSRINDNTGVIVFTNGEQDQFDHSINFYLWNNVLDTISTTSLQTVNCSYISTPCQRSETYWINNSSQWALNAVPMKLGTKFYYTDNQIRDLLKRTVKGDASIVLAKALITAKFNVAQGSELSPIVLTINAAMNLIGQKRVPFEDPVSFSSPLGIQMLSLAATLNSYNSGAMNSFACSENAYRMNGNVANISDEKVISETNNSFNVFPNPVSNSATISFAIPKVEKVSVKIFDLNGRLILQLINNTLQQGQHQITWNRGDVPSGIYLARLDTGNYSVTKKISVIK